MSFMICLGALAFLIFVAYRGFSVILFAPIAALGAVLLTDPSAVLPVYSGLFMDAMVGFIKNYFPVFMLGALFGKVIELSGFARSIVSSVIGLLGQSRAMLAIALVGALLTYGGVSLFVVVFAVYPFAAEMFRQGNIPKHLIPGTIALGAFTFTMDSLPGTPQIQNIIPTTFFNTNAYAAPILGTIGGVYILVVGILYLNWRRKTCAAAGEDYASGVTLLNEPETKEDVKLVNPAIAILPLFVVGIGNLVFTKWVFPAFYNGTVSVTLATGGKTISQDAAKLLGIWSVEAALVLGTLTVALFAFSTLKDKFIEGSKSAVAGSLLASLNTASEYGFGSVIASLPGFIVIRDALSSIPNPLVNEAITVSTLAGVTGSASGGMSIALAAMADHFKEAATAAGIPFEVLHRVAAMASGGMDTLPHNGAVITLLAVTGLTHKQSYRDIFAITCIKTSAVFVVIAIYYLTGLV
jgi:H+/gluconate symporter-like permease